MVFLYFTLNDFFTLLTTELRPEKHTGHWCTAWRACERTLFSAMWYWYFSATAEVREMESAKKRGDMCPNCPVQRCSLSLMIWQCVCCGFKCVALSSSQSPCTVARSACDPKTELERGPSLTAPTLQTWDSMIQNPKCLSFSAFLWLSCVWSRL